ncbi:MAG: serine/threonine protein kinase [Firmicutes bacterium]|nr:serine/threonine protein kinase [Bacillota bacterium]
MNKGDILRQRYEINDIIGTGGMSEVFIAADLKNSGYAVVVKKLLLTRDANQIRDYLYSFQQEFKILASLHHPNIPTAYDFFEENNQFFLVEDYIRGEQLQPGMAGMQPDKVVKVIIQLCDVLEYLHRHNIIYRDLKPENIIMTPDERIYLVDFGISRIFSPEKEDDTVALGTPGYAPPEAYEKPQTDARSDIYSMCVLMHQMLTGKDPVSSAFRFDEPKKIDKSIDGELSSFVMKGLNLEPAKRYQSISEFRHSLFKLPKLRNKFKSYRSRMGKREDFCQKEKPELEFSHVKLGEYSFTLLDIIASSGASVFAAVISYMIYPWSGMFIPALVFIFAMVLILINVHGSRRKINYIRIFPSGVKYSGKNADIQVLWEDIFALELNLSRKYKELNIVTLEGDFSFTENLEGWDHIMKEVVRRSNLKARHDISGLHPEMEIYQKSQFK